MTLTAILTAVADVSGFTIEELQGKSRERNLVAARQLYCSLACKHSNNSLSDIGRLIGNRDHTTVIHSREIVKARIHVKDEIVLSMYNQIYSKYPTMTHGVIAPPPHAIRIGLTTNFAL